MRAYNEEQLEQEWQNDDIEVSFKSWLIEEVNQFRSSTSELEQRVKALEAENERLHTELVKVNQQLAQIVIGSIRP